MSYHGKTIETISINASDRIYNQLQITKLFLVFHTVIYITILTSSLYIMDMKSLTVFDPNKAFTEVTTHKIKVSNVFSTFLENDHELSSINFVSELTFLISWLGKL